MQQGVIKTLTEKGFGFISGKETNKDIFFHSKELKNARFDELRAGDRVEFEMGSGERGTFAANIHVLEN